MKKIIPFILLTLLLGCKNSTENKTSTKENSSSNKTSTTTIPVGYSSYGKKIDLKNTWTKDKFLAKVSDLNLKDTLTVKIKADVQAVCQKKGCWMKLALPQDKSTMVRFKDYGFFVPKDIKGQEVVVSGKAYVNKMPVKELRHYAKDAGKSQKEIKNITAPKKTYAFMADGVLVKD